jgi:hypothetical protein
MECHGEAGDVFFLWSFCQPRGKFLPCLREAIQAEGIHSCNRSALRTGNRGCGSLPIIPQIEMCNRDPLEEKPWSLEQVVEMTADYMRRKIKH